MTNNDRSSSGVRVTPAGASTDVVPSQGSQPREAYKVPTRLRRTEGTELVRAAQYLLERVHHGHRQALTARVLAHRDGFDVATAQHGVAIDHSALHHRAVRDQCPVLADQGMHAAERVFPVVAGEVDLAVAERVDDHPSSALTGFGVEVCGVDQACGQDPADARSRWNLGVHTSFLPG